MYHEAAYSVHFHIVIMFLIFQLNAHAQFNICIVHLISPTCLGAHCENSYLFSKPSAYFKVVTLVDLQCTKYIICVFFTKLFTIITKILSLNHGLNFLHITLVQSMLTLDGTERLFLFYFIVLWQYMFLFCSKCFGPLDNPQKS